MPWGGSIVTIWNHPEPAHIAPAAPLLQDQDTCTQYININTPQDTQNFSDFPISGKWENNMLHIRAGIKLMTNQSNLLWLYVKPQCSFLQPVLKERHPKQLRINGPDSCLILLLHWVSVLYSLYWMSRPGEYDLQVLVADWVPFFYMEETPY